MTRRKVERGAVDWAAIRAKLALASVADTPSPERAKAIMDARARKLAERPPQVATGARLDLAVFLLGNERYAIEMRWVREVARLSDYTPVPGTPEFVVGLTNLRGEIFAVIDLRKLFGLPTEGLGDLSRLVLLGDQRAEFGVLVDVALGTAAIAAAAISPAPGGAGGIAHTYVRGVTDDATIILDGQALLSDPRLVIDQSEGYGG